MKPLVYKGPAVVKKAWNGYRKTALMPKDLTKNQTEEHRLSFYAGAISLMAIILTGDALDDADDQMELIFCELGRFAKRHVQAGKK